MICSVVHEAPLMERKGKAWSQKTVNSFFNMSLLHNKRCHQVRRQVSSEGLDQNLELKLWQLTNPSKLTIITADLETRTKLCSLFNIIFHFPDPPLESREWPYNVRSSNEHSILPLKLRSSQFGHSCFPSAIDINVGTHCVRVASHLMYQTWITFSVYLMFIGCMPVLASLFMYPCFM